MPYLIFLAFVALLGCEATQTEPKITLGRELNASAQTVADTTSQFRANDVIVIQMDYGKPFPATEVELRVYQGETDRILFKRARPVKKNDSKIIMAGSASSPMTAKDILRTSTPGIYRIAFAARDSVLLEKRLELIK